MKFDAEMEQLSNNDCNLQQDRARSHISKFTLAYLEEDCCKFLKPTFSPHSGPDLNTCVYAIWGTMEAKIWKHNRFQNITPEDLKE